MEEWKDVDDNYAVSNYGNAKSKERIVITPYNGKTRNRKWKEKMLSKQLSKDNYVRVKLYNKYVSLSHLVAKAFLENPNNYTEVHHKDKNPLNNNVENLEWIDAKKHREIHSKEKCISVIQYSLDDKYIKEWPSSSETEKEGFNQSHVNDCCNGKRTTHKGFKWVFNPMS